MDQALACPKLYKTKSYRNLNVNSFFVFFLSLLCFLASTIYANSGTDRKQYSNTLTLPCDLLYMLMHNVSLPFLAFYFLCF